MAKIKYNGKELTVTLTNVQMRNLEHQGFTVANVAEFLKNKPIEFSVAVLSQVIPDQTEDEILEGFPEITDLIESAVGVFEERLSDPLSRRRKKGK